MSAIDDDAPEGDTAVAQWISRRSLSMERRACSCAWKRRFMSSSPFEAETKTVVSEPTTIERMTITTRNSIIE